MLVVQSPLLVLWLSEQRWFKITYYMQEELLDHTVANHGLRVEHYIAM
jgi:hypothetical protein